MWRNLKKLKEEMKSKELLDCLGCLGGSFSLSCCHDDEQKIWLSDSGEI